MSYNKAPQQHLAKTVKFTQTEQEAPRVPEQLPPSHVGLSKLDLDPCQFRPM